jgi:hypothetical protein
MWTIIILLGPIAYLIRTLALFVTSTYDKEKRWIIKYEFGVSSFFSVFIILNIDELNGFTSLIGLTSWILLILSATGFFHNGSQNKKN